MHLKFIYPAMLVAAAIILTACNAVDQTVKSHSPAPGSTPETIYPDGARRITTAELETLIKEGKAFVVDVRSQDAYDLGHIPGSKLIPAGDILKHVDELPRDKTIVTYCS
jgi:3-mercaptopyruvate sulfurtransferase SseA